MKKITLLMLLSFFSISSYSQLALEGFESTTGPDALPSTNWTLGTGNWAVFDNNVGTGQRWGIINTIATPPNVYQGDNAAYINRENNGAAGSTSEDYLSTPAVTIPANGQLRFYTRMFTSGNQNTIYQVKIAPATSLQTNPASYILVQQWTELDLIIPVTNFNVYTEKLVDLSAFAGQSVYVSFVKIFTQPTTSIDGDRWLIDNVQIESACLTPTALAISAITSTGATLNWTNPNGTVNGWDIEVVLAAGTPTGVPTHTSVTAPFILTGLLPNTAYKYYVRARCTTGFPSPWSTVSPTFTTNVLPPVCGGNYVDSGGVGGNYANNENLTTTICPVTAGDLVTVTFTSFNIQNGFDFLKVYDGNDVTAPLLANLSGTNLPPAFTASSASGCLTFLFTSNATTVAAGWASNVTCAPPPSCRRPTALAFNTIGTNSVNLSWTQPVNPNNSVASAWQVLALPCGSPTPTAGSTGFVSADSNPFSLAGLTSGTCYDIYVRAVCSPTDSSQWSTPVTITTLLAPPVCGGNYVDTGGLTANYPNNANETTTICPVNPGDLVTVTFTAFNIQNNFDFLKVYDGNDVSAPLLANLTGTNLPPAFTASSASGCLTFLFTSNATTVAAGWASNVTCAPPPSCRRPSALAFNTLGINSVNLSWTQPVNPNSSVASAWQVLALPCGSPAPTAGSTGFVSADSNPFSLTGLTSGTCYDIYVRAVCSPTDSSQWSTPVTITTLLAPPVCGGNFVDTGGLTANYPNNANQTTTICPVNPGDLVTVTFTAFNIQNNIDFLKVYDGNDVSAPLLANLTGTAIPPAFTASSASGCLTFLFTSNATTNAAGWASNVTCTPAPSCRRPSALTSNTVTINSVNLNWTQPVNPNSTTASAWQVLALPCGSPAPTDASTGFVTAGSNPFTLTGLTPATCYNIYVRAVCSPTESSQWSTPVTITTLIAPPVCGGNFLDAGGTTGPYAPNSNVTTTICPVNPGDQVTVTFTAFNTEVNFDGLYVYNGNAVVPANLIPSANGAGFVPGGLAGSYWGTAIPGPFTSESADGCLTFVFRSDGSVNNAGWVSNITCAPPPTCRKPTAVITSAITLNSVILNWTQPTNPNNTVASAWEVLALPCGSPLPTAASTGFVPAGSNPFTLTGLTPATCYNIYIRAVCSSTDSSLWSIPVTITTALAPPVCGGNFVDSGGLTANYPNNANQTTTICPVNPGDAVTVTFTAFNTQLNTDFLKIYDGNDITGTLLANLSGTALPPSFTSSAASGCLTFVFTSTATVNAAGWTSNITCAPQPVCRAPIVLTNSTTTHNSVALNWIQPANPNASVASSWQVLALPCGSPAPTAGATGFVTASANPFTLTGLTPATCYNIYVRAVCSSSELSTWSGPTTTTTLIAPPVCGGTFVDAGGPTANYPNNSNVTTIICPTNPGEVVTVTFTAFQTEVNFDGLYVYDGNTVNPATQIASTNPASNVPGGLAGSYWGNVIPGPFSSTAANGCLTFVFRSDGSVNNPGWVSNVTCSPAPTCARPVLTPAASVTQTSAIISWTQPLNPNGSVANSWEVLVLPAGSPIPTTNGIPATSPYTVSGLNPGTAYVFYVRAICSATDSSLWTPLNFASIPVNDECANAIFAVVNQNLNCVQTTPGTLAGATGSLPATTCPGVANDDVWFTFTATAATHVISFNNVSLPAPALNYAIFSGTNCGTLTQVGCNTGANLIAGTTYFIRVYSVSAVPQFTTFNLCIGTLPCTEAPAFCTGQTVTYANATNVPSLGTIGCLGTSPNPAFFFLQVNQAGPLSYLISQVTTAGAPIDVDYVAWGPFTDLNTACAGVPANPLSAAAPIPTPTTGCPGTLHACSYSTAAQEIMCIPNAQLCQVYVIMITNFANQAGTVTFTQTNTGGGTTSCFPINTFSYPQTNYCQGSPNPVPVLAPGAAAGTYTSTPGLVIDPVTGIINLAASTPGPYIVTSTTLTSTGGVCTNIPSIRTTRTVIITAPANATIAYASPTYCNNITSFQNPIQTGTTGGVYSALPAGLSINPVTGGILPLASTPGVYTISYTKPAVGGCVAFTTTAQVQIIASPVIVQPATVSVCNTYTLPALTVGNYYSQAGGIGTPLDINVPITSSQTVYIYATNNGCSSEKEFSVTINVAPTPTLNVTQTTCAVQTGTITVESPLGNEFQYSIDNGPFQAGVTFNNVAPGNHTITVQNITTLCLSVPVNVIINPVPVTPTVLGFSYTTPICKNATTNPLPTTETGFTTGGIFSSTTGLTIDPVTGLISLATSTPGNYTVTYTVAPIPAICLAGGSSTATIVINPVITPVTNFSYTTPVCFGDSNPLPNTSVVGFTFGGVYTSTTGLNINAATGEINLSTSTPGTYIVTYTVGENVPTCQISGSSTTQIAIVAPIQISVEGGCQSVNYVLTALPINNSFNPQTVSYNWQNSSGQTVGSNSQSITVTEIGAYTVTVTSNGCDTVSLPVNVDTIVCVIQKGISVNGDGKNDTFDLAGYNVKNLSIFNRYGEKVYTYKNYTNQWGGQSDNGDELPDGTYYYVINRDNGETKTGWIYINRAQ